MKVLITGCEGQVGQALRMTTPPNLTGLWYNRKDFDLSDTESMRAVLQREKPDRVINAAAYTKVDHAERDRDEAMAINGAAVVELTQLCAQFGAKLIQFFDRFRL